jgi:hypothetical protein
MPPSAVRLEQAQPPEPLALVSARARHALGRGAGRSHQITESGDGE